MSFSNPKDGERDNRIIEIDWVAADFPLCGMNSINAITFLKILTKKFKKLWLMELLEFLIHNFEAQHLAFFLILN